MIEFELTLNTDKSDSRFNDDTNPIVLRQQDALAYALDARIVENGVPMNLEGCVVRFQAVKPDGKLVIEPASVMSPGEGKVYYPIPAQLTQTVGVFAAYLQVIQGESVVASTENIAFRVLHGAMEEALKTSDYAPEIDRVLAYLEAQKVDQSEQWENLKLDVEQKINDIQESLESGAFVGPPGPQGPQGEMGHAVVTTLDKDCLAFQVHADGNLYMLYDDETTTPPDMYINEDGCLIRRFGTEEGA